MRFGPVPVAEAAGLISAHTVRRDGITLRKGAVIPEDAAAGLARVGLSEIVAAALEPGDVGEDAAAARLAAHLRGPNLRAEAPFTGRCNLFAETAGVLTLADAATLVGPGGTVPVAGGAGAPPEGWEPLYRVPGVQLVDDGVGVGVRGPGQQELGVVAQRVLHAAHR